ncbi:hypothetical protein BG003_001000 [Podila horticola]|nr:hypothetical protein BG003_001000 [Podila horticola]
MAIQLKSDFVMVINYRKGPVGTHIPLQTEFPASVPYRLTVPSDTLSSLMTRISGLVRQFPQRVQMQRNSAVYLYVESFKKSHSDPKDHYIELTAESYQPALTQDWLRQYQQCLNKPEFSSDKTDNFIKLQLFIFIEDYTLAAMKHITTYIQPPVKNTAPRAPVPPAPTQPTVQALGRAPVAETATASSSSRFLPAPHTGKSGSSTAEAPHPPGCVFGTQRQQQLSMVKQFQPQMQQEPQQQYLQRQQLLEETRLEEKQRLEEEEQWQRLVQWQQQQQQRQLLKKQEQEQERARRKTQEALIRAQQEYIRIQEEKARLREEKGRRREERRQQKLLRQRQQPRQTERQLAQPQCQCPKHRHQRLQQQQQLQLQQQQQQFPSAVQRRGGREAHGTIELQSQAFPIPLPKEQQAVAVRQVSNNAPNTAPYVQERNTVRAKNVTNQQQPEKPESTEPTVMEQIVAASSNKQKAQEETHAVELAPKKSETPKPRKPLTRQAAQQQREENMSGGNILGAQSPEHDRRPKRSTRSQEAVDAKSTQAIPTTAAAAPQEGYRTVTVNINGVDMPLAIEVGSLRAALGLTDVRDIQSIHQKRRAPEPTRRSKRLAA